MVSQRELLLVPNCSYDPNVFVYIISKQLFNMFGMFSLVLKVVARILTKVSFATD